MNPYLSPKDIKVYEKYLDLANIYFEFGSGGSTFYACSLPNIKKIYSTESDPMWINRLKGYNLIHESVDKGLLEFIFVDLKIKGGANWGYPGPDSTYEDWKKYGQSILKFANSKIDTILIDGRFRVACALHCLSVIDNDTIILFDDFNNRPYYHILLDYYDIVEKGGDRLAVLKKKIPNVVPSIDLIKKYENDSR